jgi:hypothetical protein
MAKKIILGILLAGLIGLLVWGGINRTLAKTADNGCEGQYEALHTVDGQGIGGQSNEANAGLGGQGMGAGQQAGQDASASKTVGRGQGEQGLGTGSDQGVQAGEQPGGGYGGQNDGQGGGLAASGGNPQAEVSEWVTLQGVVESVSTDSVVITAATGEAIILDGRAWSFAQEAGFTVQSGDEVTLTGFYDDGELEIGYVEDVTSGQSIQLREQSGRPAWAGNGRWNK